MHIHLDLVGGLAGDMFLAAAIDAGLVEVERLTDDLRTLGLGEGIVVETSQQVRGAISGTHVRFNGWDAAAESDHRHLTTIRQMIDDSGLQPSVKARARALFEALGEAESKIHGISLERVHFHEVGAVDSILDFVSAAWVIEEVHASWSCSAVPVGRGMITTAHGQIPVPAPAAAELLKGMPISPRDVEAELVTPTGAAILRGLDPSFQSIGGVLDRTGYGLGTRELDSLSNVARMMVFRDPPTTAVMDEVLRLETDVDDMTAELLAAADRALLESGAIDVSRVAVQMKKGRLGTRLTVLAPPDRRDAVLAAIFRHTSTFGVRIERIERATLQREIVTTRTKFGPIDVKIGRLGSEVVQRSPEFADCEAAAREHNVSVEAVHRAAIAEFDD